MPDDTLSPAARDVLHELAELDVEYREKKKRDASKPELVLLLARRYISARLKRGER